MLCRFVLFQLKGVAEPRVDNVPAAMSRHAMMLLLLLLLPLGPHLGPHAMLMELAGGME